MNRSILSDKFSSKETLSQQQAAKLKGGDDKRPPIKLPIPDPLPTPNGCTQNAQGNSNAQ